MTVGRIERLLPWACVLSAGVLFASELMTMFEFTPPGAEPLQAQSAADRHGNAMFVIAGFAILLTITAVWAGCRPAALGVAVMGVIALLIFLVTDLPDAGQVGTLDDARQSFIDAEALPQSGFWLEMLGALGLAISGGALATMTAEQLEVAARQFLQTRRPEREGTGGEELGRGAGAFGVAAGVASRSERQVGSARRAPKEAGTSPRTARPRRERFLCAEKWNFHDMCGNSIFRCSAAVAERRESVDMRVNSYARRRRCGGVRRCVAYTDGSTQTPRSPSSAPSHSPWVPNTKAAHHAAVLLGGAAVRAGGAAVRAGGAALLPARRV